MSSNPLQIDWSKANSTSLIIVQENGDIKLVDRVAGSGEKLDWNTLKPQSTDVEFLQATCARLSFKNAFLLAIGTVSGALVFYDTRKAETLSVETRS